MCISPPFPSRLLLSVRMILPGKLNHFHSSPYRWLIRRWKILSAAMTESGVHSFRSSRSAGSFATCSRILHGKKNAPMHATVEHGVHPIDLPSSSSSSSSTLMVFPSTDSSMASPCIAAAKRKGKKFVSPAVALRREVHQLVSLHRVEDALQLVWKGIYPLVVTSTAWSRFLPPFLSTSCTPTTDGKAPPTAGEKEKEEHTETRCHVCPPNRSRRSSVVFDWAAFTSVLYLCARCGRSQDGVDLLEVIRPLFLTSSFSFSSTLPSSSASLLGSPTDVPSVILPPDDWMKEERFLSLLLRLQCGVHNEKEATHLVSFLLQHHLLRARTASTYLHFCLSSSPSLRSSCRTTTTAEPSSFSLADRHHKAWVLYQECRRRQILLSLADITAVGKLWVWHATALLHGHTDEEGTPPSLLSRPFLSRTEKGACEGAWEEDARWKKRDHPVKETHRTEEETLVPTAVGEKGGDPKKKKPPSESTKRVVLAHLLDALPYLLGDLREQEIAIDAAFLDDVLRPLSRLWERNTPDADVSFAAAARDDGVTCWNRLSVHVFTPSLPASPASTSTASPSSSSSPSLSWCSRPIQASCPHCQGALQKQPFTEAQRKMLLQQLEESILVQAAARQNGSFRPCCTDPPRGKERLREEHGTSAVPVVSSSSTAARNPPSPPWKKPQPPLPPGFLHWKTLLRQEVDAWTIATSTASTSSSSRVPYDIFIDGANVGYYGVSKWVGVAAAQQKWLPDGRGDAPGTPRSRPHDMAEKKKRPAVVRVQLDFALIDQALQQVTRVYGFRRPLILLHARHCRAAYLTPENAAILKQWEAKRVVYASPFGSNDDAWWLYGALYLHPYASSPISSSSSSSSFSDGDGDENDTKHNAERNANGSVQEGTRSSGVYVLTNDKCRDHHFQFLSPRCFARWRDQFCIRFHCERESGVTHVRLDWPPAYSSAPQKIEWKETNRKATPPTTDASGKCWSWHLPIAASRLSSASSPSTEERRNEEEKDESMTRSDDRVEEEEEEKKNVMDEKWVCVTYHSQDENVSCEE